MVRKYNVVEKLSKPLTVCCLPGLGPFNQQQLNNADRIPIATVGTGYNEVFVLRVGMEPPFTVLTSFEDPRLNSKNQLPTFQYTLSTNLTNHVFQPAKEKETKVQPPVDSKQDKKTESNDSEESSMSDVDEYLNKMDKEFNEEKQETEKQTSTSNSNLSNEKNKEKTNAVDRDTDGSWVVKFQFDDTANLLSYCKGLDVCLLTPFKFDLDQLSTKEAEQMKRDLHETDRLRTLNDLETFVYTVRDKLQTTHQEFVDSKHQSQLQSKLDETESWLYENRGASLDNLMKKYNNLTSQFEPVENNYKVYLQKEQGLQNFFARVNQLYQYSCGSEAAWVSVPEEERAKVASRLNQLNSNTMELVEKEKNLPKYNKPLFTMEQLDQQLKNVTEEMDQLVKKYKVVEQKNETKEPQVTEPEEQQDVKMEEENQEEMKVEEMEVEPGK